MDRTSIHLTRAARESGLGDDDIRAAAKAAIAMANCPGDIHFLKFKVGRKQFSLAARTVIEVDIFPHEVPNRVILPQRY